MYTKNVDRRFSKSLGHLLLAATILNLLACGAGNPDSAGRTPSTNTASLTLTMTTNGQSVSSISSGAPATVKATVKDETGTAVAGAVVVFSTDPTLGTISPSETALTNASGVATVVLSAASVSAAGATTISAISQSGTTALNEAIGYSVGAAVVTITNPVFGTSPLSAFGTTSISVTVSSGGVPVTTPQTVLFTSPCGDSGKASLSTGIHTDNGVATASYRDIGCAGTDTITATVSGGLASSSSQLVVTSPTVGSIQYVSATPTNLSLKGIGGEETAQVVFKVVDTGGNPIGGKPVTFTPSVTTGGITITPSAPDTTITDSNGLAIAMVHAGTVSTPVRLLATTPGAGGSVLSTQSNQLVISTGIATQSGFSISATVWNIEGWDYDGVTTVITARLADHYSNPVPDGTAVSFIAEGGAIDPSCTTVKGMCTVTFYSQNTRPTNGRISILAYAVGEESFIDSNNNGLADPVEQLDANGRSMDLGNPFLDSDENNAYTTGETYFDLDGSAVHVAPDGEYSGILCNPATTGFCSAKQSLYISNAPLPAKLTAPVLLATNPNVVVLSTSYATIAINGGSTIALPPCDAGVAGAPDTFTVTVVDRHGNAMPAGTTISFSSDNGTITSEASKIVLNTPDCRTGFSGCPSSAGTSSFGEYFVTMKSDATADSTAHTCTNTSASGTFTVKVTTPKGLITTSTVDVTD